MKHFLFSGLFCLLTFIAVGQERHTFGIFRSFPIAKFGKKDLDGGGFAKSGWGFVLQNNAQPKLFPKFLSLGTRISYQKNVLDNGAMSQKFSEVLGFQTQVGEASYAPVTLLIGPQLEFGIGGKRYVQLKSGFGFMFTRVEAFRIQVLDPQGNTMVDDVIDASGNIPFSYLIGAHIRQEITKNISLGFFSDYSSAKGQMGAKLGKAKIPKSEFDITTLSLGLSLRLEF